MTTAQRGLSVVQDLYLLQVDLQKYLQSDLRDPSERREAQARVREFSSLLKQADWRYMGGEDVLSTLHDVEVAARQKLVKKAPTVSKRVAARAARTTTKKIAAKKSAKVTKKKR